MAQRSLTITLPRSTEALHNALQMLLQYGLISEKKARTITQEETHKKSRGENRWALVAEEMSQQGFLEGSGDDIMETIRDFRDGFEIPMPGNKTAE